MHSIPHKFIVCLLAVLSLSVTLPVFAQGLEAAAPAESAQPVEVPVLTCPAPANVAIVSQGTGSIAFDWDDCGCMLDAYLVSYYRQGDAYASPVHETTVSGYGFSGLPAGTYDFFFQTDCGGGVSGVIVVEDVLIQ